MTIVSQERRSLDNFAIDVSIIDVSGTNFRKRIWYYGCDRILLFSSADLTTAPSVSWKKAQGIHPENDIFPARSLVVLHIASIHPAERLPHSAYAIKVNLSASLVLTLRATDWRSRSVARKDVETV